jgi:predicted lipid-binding transport protein (Tim44 family)
MKRALAVFAVVLAVGMTAALDAEAKRLGGGKSSGMQRQQTSQPANQTGTPAQQAAPAAAPTAAAAPGAAAAAAPKRSWMGPVAGLAAGLGIAALASHFGFGEALANMLTIGLIVMAVLLLVGFIMRKRMGTPAAAPAGAGGAFRMPVEPQQAQPAQGGSMIGSRIGGGIGAGVPVGSALPADFDAPAFERNAADQFMALQSANDAADLDRLRGYLTPEMFEAVRADVAERGGQPQATQVFGLQARVLAVAEEADRYVVSVRFTGSVREEKDAMPTDLDETWHLVKPRTGFGGWVVAGIQQNAA